MEPSSSPQDSEDENTFEGEEITKEERNALKGMGKYWETTQINTIYLLITILWLHFKKYAIFWWKNRLFKNYRSGTILIEGSIKKVKRLRHVWSLEEDKAVYSFFQMEIEDSPGTGNEGTLRGELDSKSSRIVHGLFLAYFICTHVIKVSD